MMTNDLIKTIEMIAAGIVICVLLVWTMTSLVHVFAVIAPLVESETNNNYSIPVITAPGHQTAKETCKELGDYLKHERDATHTAAEGMEKLRTFMNEC
jgi:hypothetical protein